MTQREDVYGDRDRPETIDALDEEANGTPAEIRPIGPMVRHAAVAAPSGGSKGDDQKDPPLESEDGDMFIHAEGDMDY